MVSVTPECTSIVINLLNWFVLLFRTLGVKRLGACKMALSKHTILTTFHGALMGVRKMNLGFAEGNSPLTWNSDIFSVCAHWNSL